MASRSVQPVASLVTSSEPDRRPFSRFTHLQPFAGHARSADKTPASLNRPMAAHSPVSKASTSLFVGYGYRGSLAVVPKLATWAVHAAPSQYRCSLRPRGSWYQPAGGRVGVEELGAEFDLCQNSSCASSAVSTAIPSCLARSTFRSVVDPLTSMTAVTVLVTLTATVAPASAAADRIRSASSLSPMTTSRTPVS